MSETAHSSGNLAVINGLQLNAQRACWHLYLASESIQLSDRALQFLGIESDETTLSLERFLQSIHPVDRKEFLRQCTFRQEGEFFSCILRNKENPEKCVAMVGEYVLSDKEGMEIIGRCGRHTHVEDSPKQIVTQDKGEITMLRTLLDQAGSLVAVKNIYGEYTQVNRLFAECFDSTPKELTGKKDSDLFEESIAAGISRFDNWMIEQGAPLRMEESLPIKGNNHTFVSVRFPIKDHLKRITGIGISLTDITERKHYEETIAQQRKSARLVLDSVDSHIWFLDSQGRLQDCNRHAASAAGVHIADIRGKTLIEQDIYWPDPEQEHREVMKVISTGCPILNSHAEIVWQGKKHWVRIDKTPALEGPKVTGVLLMVTDDTDLIEKEHELEESDARYKAFIANSAEAIWRLDVNPPVSLSLSDREICEHLMEYAVFAEGNNKLAEIQGFERAEDMVGKRLVDVMDKEQLFRELKFFVRSNYRTDYSEFLRTDRKKQDRWISTSCFGEIEDNKLYRIWGTHRDITEMHSYQDQLKYQASHDSLTGMPNRASLYEEMNHSLVKAEPGQQMALLLIDLDRFKEINDTLGHQTGDQVLKQLGPRLEAELTDLDAAVCRLGGDEFAVFIRGVRSFHHAEVLGHRLLDAIKQPFCLGSLDAEIGASVGISMYPMQAEDVSSMMRCADVAMYHAKNNLLGCALYDIGIDNNSPERLALINDFHGSVRKNQLTLHYQPKVDLITNQVHGFEALLRWVHPERGMVPPGEFIPLVEITEMIHEVTAWVLDESIRQCRAWWDEGLRTTVAVNLSARNLIDDRLPNLIPRLLAANKLPPSALILEITESSLIVDPHRATLILQQLEELGISIAIDDYGTGYSSLGYLQQLPVKTLKIDYSFVKDMINNVHNAVIVRSTIQLAHNLGLKVVAEGVEEEQLLNVLKNMGCDEAQGYFIARPMDALTVRQWINESQWQVREE
ncbi:MAG: EAL domain-containing protein [Cellvibrionaceae bacterium]